MGPTDTCHIDDQLERVVVVMPMYTLCEFGRVCERRKLRVNVGKSKVMRCSRYGNGDRMHVILNCEPL